MEFQMGIYYTSTVKLSLKTTVQYLKTCYPWNSLPEMEGRLSRQEIINKGLVHW